MNKKLIIILSFCFFEFLLLTYPAMAVTSTPSATPTDLEDKIKSLVKDKLEITEIEKQKEIVGPMLLGFTGTVKSIGSKNITLEVDSDLLQVSLLSTTKITKSNNEIKPTAIALTDKLLIIGTKTKEEVLEAKIINVFPAETDEEVVVTKTQIAYFKNIDTKKKTFTLTINNEDLAFTLSKKSNVKLEDFKDGDKVLAITKKYLGKYSLSRAVKI